MHPLQSLKAYGGSAVAVSDTVVPGRYWPWAQSDGVLTVTLPAPLGLTPWRANNKLDVKLAVTVLLAFIVTVVVMVLPDAPPLQLLKVYGGSAVADSVTIVSGLVYDLGRSWMG